MSIGVLVLIAIQSFERRGSYRSCSEIGMRLPAEVDSDKSHKSDIDLFDYQQYT